MRAADLPLSDLLSLAAEVSFFSGVVGGALGAFCYGLLGDAFDWLVGRFSASSRGSQ